MKGKTSPESAAENSAQMHTLEAIVASMIMVGIIIFTIQATSLTPLTSSTANAHIEAQLQTMGQDMLSALAYSAYGQDSQLKKDIQNWDGTKYVWNGSGYRSTDSQNKGLQDSSLADVLKLIAVPRGIAHNVHFSWVTDDGIMSDEPYIYNGDPSDNAVIISKKVVLSDNDVGNKSVFTADTGIPDADSSTDFYNIVNVKMTLWRM
ncbi:hypothetical protein V7O62_08015 [Methanolobus sp. ZRKC2]|uniref:DUF7288 family protein n=1 Tax=Methanolobus sp. ZRKC2 TaxID=3125783 RepID=UPI0032476DCA